MTWFYVSRLWLGLLAVAGVAVLAGCNLDLPPESGDKKKEEKRKPIVPWPEEISRNAPVAVLTAALAKENIARREESLQGALEELGVGLKKIKDKAWVV